jgi:hypothetical protein
VQYNNAAKELIKTYTSTGDLKYSLCFLICCSEERTIIKLNGGLGKGLGDWRVAENIIIKTIIMGSREEFNQILHWKSVERFDNPRDFWDANHCSRYVNRAISVCQISNHI